MKAASVDGAAVSGVTDNGFETTECAIAGAVDCANGMQFTGVYKFDAQDNGEPVTGTGINGTYFCQGDKCALDGNKLTGGWYFTPTSTTTPYVADKDKPMVYDEDTAYAEYGYWLKQAETPGNPVTVYTYARYGSAVNLPQSGNVGASETLAASAKYEGDAIGMSVHRVGEDVQSGHFDAKVNLDVKFGIAPTISGEISNFSGDAVGDWSVELMESTFVDGTIGTTDDDGNTFTSNNTINGAWTARSYGETNARPTGIFGTFNANFVDGNATGAYATR